MRDAMTLNASAITFRSLFGGQFLWVTSFPQFPQITEKIIMPRVARQVENNCVSIRVKLISRVLE